ncbi:MAG: hypothetical protein JNK64_28175 [Myxococcales bacterium]|nr:hypothetical protein [Myxococcales bacterium]
MGTGSLAESETVRDLEATMVRFKGPPLLAFGLTGGYDATALRASFMALCKRYHPAKYARFSPPTVRLANEVFLVIRRAHDDLARGLTAAPPRPGTPSNGVPIAGAAPRRAATPPTGVPITGAPPRRAATPPTGVPVVRPPSPAARPAGVAPPASTPPPSAASPRPGVAPARPSPTPPRPTSTVPAPAAAPPRAAAPVGPAASTATTRTSVVPPPAADRGPSLNPKLGPPPASDPRFERALEHLRERRWAEARPLLSELSARSPTDVRYRAYLHYLRGWEAFELGKDGEARAEWRRALACDPGLGMAQWALQKTGLG